MARRRDLASALRSAGAGLIVGDRKRRRDRETDTDPELALLRDQTLNHPVHRMPDREAMARTGERYLRVERDNAVLGEKIAAATNSLARTFDRIVGLLSERGFIRVDGADLVATDDGRLLARIYSESDLLVAECLRTGAWRDLAPAELAAMVSAVVYESRGGEGPAPQLRDVPTAGLRRALIATRRLSGQLRIDENRHRIAGSREPDEGFVVAAHRWATTGDLAASLEAADRGATGTSLSAGDFVRWCRQILDVLDQVRIAAPEPGLRAAAKRAIDDVRRGVVAVDIG